ncbi:MAG: hypothetical protein WBP81_21735 [Solirubrobacteraceae bacterium]
MVATIQLAPRSRYRSDLALVCAAAGLVSERDDGWPDFRVRHRPGSCGQIGNKHLERPHMAHVAQRLVIPETLHDRNSQQSLTADGSRVGQLPCGLRGGATVAQRSFDSSPLRESIGLLGVVVGHVLTR